MDWLIALGRETHEELKYGMDLSQGFFQIVWKDEPTTQKISCIYYITQGEVLASYNHDVPSFNPRKPEKMKMRVWITLKDVLLEYKSSRMDIGESLRPVLEKIEATHTIIVRNFV